MTISDTPVLISTTEELNKLVESLRSSNWLGVDTEFERRRTYYAKLCLIQLATDDRISCIDPLSCEDLSPLNTLFGDPHITKILHSASQDLEVLHQRGLFLPKPMFDTQLAAAFLGLGDQISYAQLVEQLTGVQLAKTQTRTDWTKRPLTELQMRYAIDDVRYLGTMQRKLNEKLISLGRNTWLNEACDKMLESELYQASASQAWKRLRRGRRLSNKAQQRLKHLSYWREVKAQELNKPRQWIVPDKCLYQLAENPVRTVEELHQIDGMDANTIRRNGEKLISILQKTLDTDEVVWAEKSILSPEQKELRRTMAKLLNQKASELSISTNLLGSRGDIEKLILCQAGNRLLEGWRYDIIGKTLVGML